MKHELDMLNGEKINSLFSRNIHNFITIDRPICDISSITKKNKQQQTICMALKKNEEQKNGQKSIKNRMTLIETALE